MFADVTGAGLVMLGGWMAVLVGVASLRESSPLRRGQRAIGALAIVVGAALAVYARGSV